MRRLLGVVAALLGAVAAAGATTVVARSDAELIALADRVVHARVIDVRAEQGPGRTIVTVARLRILEDFTGESSRELVVRELGGRLGDRVMQVSGAAAYVTGDEILVCLERARDGRWRSVAMGYSQFRVERALAGEARNGRLSRSAAGLDLVGEGQGATATRTLDEFRRIAAAVTGVRSVRHAEADQPAAGALTPAPTGALPVSENFTLLSGGLRWNEADAQQPVQWFRNAATPAPVEIGDVDTAMVLATQAWTAPPEASIVLGYGGTLAIGGDDPYCGDSHAGRGLVSFEDPTFEIPSGTLAVGGGCADAAGGKVVNGTAFDRFTHGFVVVNNAVSLSASIRNALNLRRVIEHEVGHGVGLGHSSISTSNIMYPSCCSFDAPVPPAIGSDDRDGLAFIYPPDMDQDALPDEWEMRFGLDPASALGADGANGDPDGDGATNADELAAGTHPRGFHVRHFAEGAASGFFETSIGLANPSETVDAHVLLTFLPTSRPVPPTTPGANLVRHALTVPRQAHRTVVANNVGLPASAEFATVVESDAPVAADRTLAWDRSGTRYGAHAEAAIDAPAPEWFLAEGATHSGFATFYLLQNPQAFEIHVDVTYLRPAPAAPFTKTYVVEALTRRTIWLNVEDTRLASTDVSGRVSVQGGYGIVVERAMYRDAGGLPFEAGHAGAGAPSLASTWFFAEGKTGPWFDEYLLLANPASDALVADITYMTSDGTVVTRAVDVPGASRVSIDVEREDPRLADAEVAALVTARDGRVLVAERALWWGGAYPAWIEAHAALGSTATAARWVCATGEAGGVDEAETYVLIANVAATPRDVRVRLLPEDGPVDERTLTVGGRSRFNVAVSREFPAAGRAFAVVVESLAGTPDLVVERAIYWHAGGAFRAGAGNACSARP